MKATVAGFTVLLAALPIIASPHNAHHHHHPHKRAIELITETNIVYKTEMAMHTVWVYPDGSPVKSQNVVAPAAAAPAPTQAVHEAPAPAAAAHTVAKPAPAAHKAPVAAPEKPVQPPSPAAKPVPKPAPAPAKPAPAPASGSGTFTGDMTYYAVGLGSCGWTSTADEAVVAIPHGQMDNPANPNANPLCGKMVTIHYGGKTKQAKVVDTCMGCANGALDMSTSLFSYFAPMSLGRVPGMTWSFD